MQAPIVLLIMKKLIYAACAILIIMAAFAFTTLRHYTDIFKQLQIDPADAKESIFTNFQDGVLDFPYSTMVIKFAVGKRQAAVKELGDYIKAYTESAEFAAKYKEAREAARPQGVATSEEKIKARIEQVKQDIQDTEADLPKQTGDMKKLYESQLKELKKELKALSNPADPAYSWYAEQITEVKGSEKNFAVDNIKYWQQDYPATVKELVKKRLEEFLDLTKDIDFNAQLVKSGSKMVFADAALEAKSWEWKRCFRCGKETILAARQYAQQWLATLK